MDTLLSNDLISTGKDKINSNFGSLPELIQSYIDNLDWQQSVLSRTEPTPVSAVTGDRYIVSAVIDNQDPWYGHTDEIATKTDAGWDFVTPNKGYCVAVEDENLEYVWSSENEWISRAYATWHNHLGGLDGGDVEDQVYYHLSQDTYLGLASVTEIDPAVVDSDARLSDTRDPNAHDHVEANITDLGSYSLSDHDHALTYAPIVHTHSYAASDHDLSHLTGGGDEIDGDKLDIDFTPSNYTPNSNVEYSDNLDHLASHLNGIDAALGDKVELVLGLIPTSNLGTGTADSTTYLRGDQTWAILASGNNFVTVTAGETLAKYDIVYINTSDSNKAYKAKCNGTLLQSEVLGMVTETGGIALNGTGQVIVNGTQTYGSWTWTPNKWLYLDSTSGTLTQTLSTTNGQYAVPVAIALSATQIYIQPMTGWVVNNNDNITLGCKKVTFDETSGTVAILTPPANAVITQITVVVTNDAAASGGSIKIGTAADDDIVMASTVVDLEEAGNHVYDPFYLVGSTPVQYNLSVTAGAQEFDGVVYFHYTVPNVVTGTGGCLELDFTQATSSPALLGVLPDNVVVTRCTVVVDTAASGGSPTVSIGTVGDSDLLFDETDCDLSTQGIYLYDPFVETSGGAYLTITPDSQSFAGRAYVQYMAVN